MKHFITVTFVLAALSACGGASVPEPQKNLPERITNMPAGFQVIGQHGVVQVDENYYNMVYRTRGSALIRNNGRYNSATINYQGEANSSPMLCTAYSNVFLWINSLTKSGDNYTFEIAANGEDNVSYFIFDKVAATPTNAGLEVYNANGGLVFSSNQRPMRVVSVFPVASGTPIQPASYTPLPFFFAACLSAPRISLESGIIKVEALQAGFGQLKTMGVPHVNLGNNNNVAIQPYGGIIMVVNIDGIP